MVDHVAKGEQVKTEEQRTEQQTLGDAWGDGGGGNGGLAVVEVN